MILGEKRAETERVCVRESVCVCVRETDRQTEREQRVDVVFFLGEDTRRNGRSRGWVRRSRAANENAAGRKKA